MAKTIVLLTNLFLALLFGYLAQQGALFFMSFLIPIGAGTLLLSYLAGLHVFLKFLETA